MFKIAKTPAPPPMI